MIIFYIYVIKHISDYEPDVDEVGVPIVEDQHLLHQVCDANVQPPEGEGCGVVLANVQDGADLTTTVRYEVERDRFKFGSFKCH